VLRECPTPRIAQLGQLVVDARGRRSHCLHSVTSAEPSIPDYGRSIGRAESHFLLLGHEHHPLGGGDAGGALEDCDLRRRITCGAQ
jgi:hypothetical protein